VGVAVTASSDALMRPRQTLTDIEGFYRFPALPPGDYTLAFARQGFTTPPRDAIHIGVGFTATIDVVMELATLEERVTVEHRSPVGTSSRSQSPPTSRQIKWRICLAPGT
jgi:hypothetical protein